MNTNNDRDNELVAAPVARPLGRITAREVTAEEMAMISGGASGCEFPYSTNPNDQDRAF